MQPQHLRYNLPTALATILHCQGGHPVLGLLRRRNACLCGTRAKGSRCPMVKRGLDEDDASWFKAISYQRKAHTHYTLHVSKPLDPCSSPKDTLKHLFVHHALLSATHERSRLLLWRANYRRTKAPFFPR